MIKKLTDDILSICSRIVEIPNQETIERELGTREFSWTHCQDDAESIPNIPKWANAFDPIICYILNSEETLSELFREQRDERKIEPKTVE